MTSVRANSRQALNFARWRYGPKKWKGFSVSRKFRGVTYSIEVTNPKSKSKGVKSLKIDGQKIDGNVIPFLTDGRTAVKVEVTLGA